MKVVSCFYPCKAYPCVITNNSARGNIRNDFSLQIFDCNQNLIKDLNCATVEHCILRANEFYSEYNLPKIKGKKELKPYEHHFNNDGLKLIKSVYPESCKARFSIEKCEKDIESLSFDKAAEIIHQIDELLSQLK